MSHNNHINNHRKHFNAVSDIDAAITLATISSNNVDNDYLTSLVSPSTPQMPSVTTIDDIAALTDISFIMDSPKCEDEHVDDKATGSGAGSYQRKDSAATKPLPKNLPVVPKERHIPAHKKKTCALTFPERLMSMLDYAEEMKAKSDDPDNYCVTWLPKGDAFLIRDPKAYAETVIPKFFKAAKFSSFSRKLYRWGFHQIQREDADAAALPAGAIIFASEHFKRDARHEMANMRSTTAAGEKRKVDQIEGMGIFKEDSSSKAKIDVNVFGISGSAGQSSTASLSTSNLFIGSEQGRGSVSTMSDIMSKKPASRQPLKKRAIEKVLPPSNHNAKFEDFTKIAKSNLFQNSTWGSVTGFNESSLPMLVPTSDQIVLNDQVSKFLTMSQVGTHKVSLGPAQMDSSRNLSIERGLLISGQRNFIGGVSGRHPVMSLSSTHLQYKNNEHLIRLFRSAADALERTIV